jgi:hypothetical protein
MILDRVSRLIARVRGAKPAAAPPPPIPVKTWSEGLAEAGVTAETWLAARSSNRRLFIDLPDARIEELRAREPALARGTLEAAERVLRHEFDLLGSGPYLPIDPDRATGGPGYQPIDWYLDPVCQLRFPRGIPHTMWNLNEMRPGLADVKLPWELARCQHWPLLGQAYRLSGDGRFAREIADELTDFMEANPIGIGINWTCTMDVAIRAANWALGLELVRSCPELPSGFWHTAYEALFDHGVFIERNPENHFEVTSNHFLSNIVGLFYLAVVFGDLPEGQKWDRQCRTWLEQEMEVQVLADGADYESSVPYHRLVAELFLGAARLAAFTGRPLSSGFDQRLRSMIDFLAAVLRPDGLMPQVGDADDGRLHVLSGYGTWRPQDARHLFGPAACLFAEPRWLSIAGPGSEWESGWWGFDTASRPSQEPVHEDVRQFPHAGLTVMRQRDDYLLITNGIVGTGGFGNHKHNDLLGFEYHLRGVPILVDPGSYVYTSDPEARNLFRSTRSHNTIGIDGQEQNEIRPDWLFRTFEKAHPEHLSLTADPTRLVYRGRHHGYARLPQPVVHERTFVFERADGALTLVDSLEGSGTHHLRWHFHFAPGVAVVRRDRTRFDIRTAVEALTMEIPAAARAEARPAWYSPSYGVRVECVAVDFDLVDRVKGKREHTVRIMPVRAGATLPSARA